MYGRMGGDRIAAESDHQLSLNEIMRSGVGEQPDVGVLASRDGDQLCVMVWHYHDDDIAGPTANVTLDVAGLGSEWSNAEVTHYRIDSEHSNSYAAWQRMGSPNAPNGRQYRRLMRASDLATLDEPQTQSIDDGGCSLEFELPRQGISLVILERK
jgi:xylan 1,4-beta-xylosidase